MATANVAEGHTKVETTSPLASAILVAFCPATGPPTRLLGRYRPAAKATNMASRPSKSKVALVGLALFVDANAKKEIID